MTAFEKWKYFYEKQWATKEQLKQVVQYGVLTESEYEQITGEPFQVG